MKRKILRIAACALFLVCVISYGAIAREKTQGEMYYDELLEMAEMLKQNHIQATAEDDPIKMGLIKMFDLYPAMYQSFVNFMFQSYDPYSFYLDAKTHDAAFDGTTYVGGVGITIEIREDGAYVGSLVEGGGAQKAGILVGDKLLEADGAKLSGFTAEMIGEIVRGEAGSEIPIRVERDGRAMLFRVTRAAMANSQVSAKLLGGGVAYLRVTSFENLDTFLDFALLYKSLPDHDVTTVVLDLRDNPGGDLSVALNVIERVLPEKALPYLMIERTNPRRVDTYTSEGIGWNATKMVILVNENTASSAELVAGALHDLGYATLVGKKTYGKGVGQMHSEVKEGEYAVITNSRFYLPVTGAFDGVGLAPDLAVEMGAKYYHIPQLAPIIADRSVYAGQGANVLALEQRLRELGYFSGTPDATADRATFLAVNRFQRAKGLAVSENYCDAATLRELDRAVRARDGKQIPVDTQYDRAVSLAKEYAEKNTPPTRVDMSTINFGEEK